MRNRPASRSEATDDMKNGAVGGGDAPRSHSNDTGVSRLGDASRLMICATGILVCYFYFGIMQEKITKTKYGDSKEPFTYTQALVFLQCVINCIFAYFLARMAKLGADETPVEMYALCSFSYLAAMIASNHALQFIAYPTQVLGKSCKPIPILVFGVLFARKRYPLAKYLCVMMIVIGVALFLYKDKKGNVENSGFSVGWGEILLLVSLSMDGTTGAVQDRIRASYTCISHHMMFNMNLWSSLYLTVGLLFTGELFAFVTFVQKYSFVLTDMLLLSLASSLGQFFIFKTVTEFGPLTCSIVTTTRKFFTILMSVIYFQNPLTGRQWIGTVLVFVGLALDSIFGKTRKK